MGRVGLNVALTAMAAVPVYGTIASALVSGGRLLYRLMTKREEKVLALPWAEYSKGIDEIYVRLRDDVFPYFDWTAIFLPPFEDAPWKVGEAKGKGLVFALALATRIWRGPPATAVCPARSGSPVKPSRS